jgi:hypothetical protein
MNGTATITGGTQLVTTATLDRPIVPTSIFADRDVFTKYRIALTFANRVMGGTPQKPEIIESWLRTRILGGDEELRIQLIKTLDDIGIEIPADATREEVIAAANKMAAERQGNTFRRTEAGELAIADYQVKALLKEATAVLDPWQDGHKWGATKKSAKSAVAEWLFVDEHAIGLGRMEPDGTHTQVGHVTGPKGPRSTLTYYDYCERASIAFTVSSVENRVTREQWERILVLGEKLGLGALRSLSHGQFCVTAFDQL